MKYRYLGMRGIFIGENHYHNGDIIEIDSFEKYGLNPKMFKPLKGIPEKERFENEIKTKENELNKLKNIYKEQFEPVPEKKETQKLKRIGGK